MGAAEQVHQLLPRVAREPHGAAVHKVLLAPLVPAPAGSPLLRRAVWREHRHEGGCRGVWCAPHLVHPEEGHVVPAGVPQRPQRGLIVRHVLIVHAARGLPLLALLRHPPLLRPPPRDLLRPCPRAVPLRHQLPAPVLAHAGPGQEHGLCAEHGCDGDHLRREE